ncbi:hypothetical protein GCM10009795_096510 [Nocardioides hankookensis]|uniref:Uncharacterized protein n=1 Tax=Nocardioides hankookensis TaxID=443157 RepID=A0ABW1LMA4_9ACTN
MTDYAARLAALRDAETQAIAALTTADAALARAEDKRTKQLERLDADVSEKREQVTSAQRGFVVAVGAERAAVVLGISVAAARNLTRTPGHAAGAKTTDHSPDHSPIPGLVGAP